MECMQILFTFIANIGLIIFFKSEKGEVFSCKIDRLYEKITNYL